MVIFLFWQVFCQPLSFDLNNTNYFHIGNIMEGMRVQWIDEQLKQKGKTRRELAFAIGFSEPQMSKVMNGSRKLSADEADAIRRYFGYRLPDDPPSDELDLIMDYLSLLGEPQKRAVVLYLEALAGAPAVQSRAS